MESRRKWSPREDALLMEGYRIQAQRNAPRAVPDELLTNGTAEPTGKGGTVNWHEVAKRVPGRDNKDCRKRYHNELDGNVKKGTWTKSEDERLKGYVREHGTQWAVIARKMETRSADQCSKRWNHSLKPELERRPWTEQEDQLLMRSLAPHGHRWREIQRTHFPSRSANDVKNQHTILVRRGVQAMDEPCGCVLGEVGGEGFGEGFGEGASSTGSSVGLSPGSWTPAPQHAQSEGGAMAVAGDQALLWGGPDLDALEGLGDEALFSMLSSGDRHMGDGLWSGVNVGGGRGVQDSLVPLPPSTQRITITVEEAEPETLTQVMDVLMRSRARVSFCRG